MMTIEPSLEKIVRDLGAFEKKQLPYALSKAINDTAFDFMGEMKKEIGSELHIFKKSIPSSIRVKKASKQKLKAEIYVDEWSWQHKVLAHHFKGGDRERKGLEKAMIYKGYMYKNEILTPPPGVRLQPSIYNKIIAQLKLGFKAGYSVNETKRSRLRKGRNELRFFVATGKINLHLAPGIYARGIQGHSKPICILRIAERPEYKKRFDMEKTLKIVVHKQFNKNLHKQLKSAVATTALKRFMK